MLRDRLVANDLETEPAERGTAFDAGHVVTPSAFEDHKLAPRTRFATAFVSHLRDGHFVHFGLLSRAQFVFLTFHGQRVGVAVVETVLLAAVLFLTFHDGFVVAVRTLPRERVFQIGFEPLVFVPCFRSDDLVDILFIEGLAACFIAMFLIVLIITVIEWVETGHVDHAVLDLAGHEPLDAVGAELVTAIPERKAVVDTVFGEADIAEIGGRDKRGSRGTVPCLAKRNTRGQCIRYHGTDRMRDLSVHHSN